MAVRRRAGGARKMMAFSRIVACHTEEDYDKAHKRAGDDLVLVEFVAVRALLKTVFHWIFQRGRLGESFFSVVNLFIFFNA